MALIYRHWFPCTVTAENPHGKGYTGQTHRTLKERDRDRFSSKKDSAGLKEAIVEYGKEQMRTDIIESDILPIPEVVDEREKYWIAYFDDFHNGYNRTKGGEGTLGRKHTPEAIAKMSEVNRKRVENGTHPFLGGDIPRQTQRKRVENGTHPFLGGDINHKYSSKNQRKRVENGTHNFQDSEFASENNRKRIEGGTHNFCRENSHNARPEYYQAYWKFILLYPLGIKEVRKHLYESFSDIPYQTLWRWVRKWQAELEESTTEK